jgi:D-alanine transaminase
MIASINGAFNHQISIYDRGVIFGESLYEVIPLYQNEPYLLNQHLERLYNSFKTLYHFELNLDQIKYWLNELIAKLPHTHFTSVYIQCSTGSLNKGRSHINIQEIQPNTIMYECPANTPKIEEYQAGFRAILFPDLRSQMASHKSTQLSINTIALTQAQQQGYHDAIFIKDGFITEAASSNFFTIKDGVLITPPLGSIVPGVTRSCVLQIAKDLGIPHQIREITALDLISCQEIFLSSSVKILKPIIYIPKHFQAISTGPIWKKIFQTYQSRTQHAYPI